MVNYIALARAGQKVFKTNTKLMKKVGGMAAMPDFPDVMQSETGTSAAAPKTYRARRKSYLDIVIEQELYRKRGGKSGTNKRKKAKK